VGGVHDQRGPQPRFIRILLAQSLNFFQWGTAQGQLSPSFNSTSWDGKLSITFPKHPPKHPTPFTHQGMATFGDDCSGLKLYVITFFVDLVVLVWLFSFSFSLHFYALLVH